MQQIAVQKQDAYKYKSYAIEDVIEETRRAFVDNLLTFHTEIHDISIIGQQGDLNIVRIDLRFGVTDSDTNTKQDWSWKHICLLDGDIDKDIGAAVSYATKYFLLRNFLISERDAPDPDFNPQVNTQYGGQMFMDKLRDRLQEYARNNNKSTSEVFQECFKVARLSDITLTVREALNVWDDYEATN